MGFDCEIKVTRVVKIGGRNHKSFGAKASQVHSFIVSDSLPQVLFQSRTVYVFEVSEVFTPNCKIK